MPNRSLATLGLLLLAPVLVRASGPSVFNQKKTEPAPPIPIQMVDAGQRETVRQILEKPTLSARSQPKAFPANVEIYRYFLDNPDRAVTAWRRLGAKCVDIQVRGKQQFRWADDNGSDVCWQTVLDQPGMRVWLAEGKVKPGPMLPLIPVKVVVVLRSSEVALPKNTTLPDGSVVAGTTTGVQHQTDIAVHTDSKTAVLVTKMLGPQAQRMAEQGLGDFQFFFGGLSYYLDQNPEQAPVLLRERD